MTPTWTWTQEFLVAAPPTLLNESQRAHLSVLAAGMEETLAEIEHFLDPRLNSDSVLTHYVADLPAGCGERIRPIIMELRTKVAAFVEQFALDARSFSRSGSISAHVSAQIIRLDESGVKQLRGYGAVAHDLDAVLAPALERFREPLVEIAAILRRGR